MRLPFCSADGSRAARWLGLHHGRPYRGSIYVGVTAHLAARVHQHRTGSGSDYCARHGLDRLVWAERGEAIADCIAHEKRLKRWRRAWKFALIEQANPDWRDLSGELI